MSLGPETILSEVGIIPGAWVNRLRQNDVTTVGQFLGLYSLESSRSDLAHLIAAEESELDRVINSIAGSLPPGVAKQYLTPVPPGTYAYGAVLPD